MAFNHKRHSRVGILIISLSLKLFFWVLFLYPVDAILISGDDNTFLFSLAGLTNSPSSSKEIVEYAQSYCICSNFALYEELLNEYQAGITVDPMDVRTAAKEISNLLEDSFKYDTMSKNGLSSLENSYNCATQKEKLFELIETI